MCSAPRVAIIVKVSLYHGVMHKTTIHVHVFTYTVMTVYYVYAHCLNLADTGGKIIYVWFNEQMQPEVHKQF
jgi:hypothetical protein